MKKVLMILAGASFLFVACGPSAEEVAAEKKRVEDSTAAAVETQRILDSTAAAAVEAQRLLDSTNAANAAKAIEDSIAAAKKKPVKKTMEQKMQEDKKVLEKQKG